MMEIFEAKSEDLSGLGGRMGTERTTVNWRRYFTSRYKAMLACDDDYAKTSPGKLIKWGRRHGVDVSGDLGHVMYTVTSIGVET